MTLTTPNSIAHDSREVKQERSHLPVPQCCFPDLLGFELKNIPFLCCLVSSTAHAPNLLLRFSSGGVSLGSTTGRFIPVSNPFYLIVVSFACGVRGGGAPRACPCGGPKSGRQLGQQPQGEAWSFQGLANRVTDC